MNHRQKIKEAEELFHHGKYIEAVHFFNEILEDLPENHSAYYRRGHCYYRIKEYDKALNDFNDAIRMNDKLSLYFGSRGSLYLAMNKPIEAIDDYNKAITMKKDFASFYHGLGRAYYKNKEYKLAHNAICQAEKKGVNVSLWEIKANCLMQQRKLEATIAICDDRIKESPNEYNAYLKKGVCLHYLGWEQMDLFIKTTGTLSMEELIGSGEETMYKAIENLSMAIHLNGNSESAYRYRGLSYNLLHDYRQAYFDFETFIKINPNDEQINTIFNNIKPIVLNHSGLKPGDKVKYILGNTVYTVERLEFVSGAVILKNDLNVEFVCADEEELQLIEEKCEYLYYCIPCLPRERWAPAKIAEYLLVSDYGRVKHINGYNERLLKITKNSCGDCFIKIRSKPKEKSKYSLLSRLVAQAFIPNPHNKLYIKHLDYNLENNWATNLNWVIKGQEPKNPDQEYLAKKELEEKSIKSPKSSNYSLLEDDPEYYYYLKGGSTNSLDWLDEETNGDWRWNID